MVCTSPTAARWSSGGRCAARPSASTCTRSWAAARGTATINDGYYGYNQGVYVDPRGRNGRSVVVVPPGYAYGYPYHYYDAFFIADPEAQLVIHFGSGVRLQGSVGYRATSTSSLNGVTGGISVQIGR